MIFGQLVPMTSSLSVRTKFKEITELQVDKPRSYLITPNKICSRRSSKLVTISVADMAVC